MKRSLTLLFALVMCTQVFAQLPSFTVLGTVFDDNSKPLSNANVSLVGAKKTLNKVTNQQGVFSFKADTGRYKLTVTHASFGQFESMIVVRPGDNILQPIKMSTNANMLGKVTVTTRKPLIEVTNDKIAYNVEADPSAKTESASDLFRKTPFLAVDGEGNVTLNGQSNFRILLNGRETSMFAANVKDALRAFPGALISKIEVITNPSAKYDAEGIGGLINIVTKNKVTGYNGNISMFRNTVGNMQNSISLNAKKGRVSFSSNAFLAGNDRFVRSDAEIITTAFDPVYLRGRTQTGIRKNQNRFRTLNMELAVELDSFYTLSMYGTIGRNKVEGYNTYDVITDLINKPLDHGIIDQHILGSNPLLSGGVDLIRKYRKPGKELSFKLFAQSFDNKSNFVSFQGPSLSNGRYQLSETDGKNREYTMQTDYSTTIGKAKADMGAKVILRKASSDNSNFIKYNVADPYMALTSIGDQFDYTQSVYSGYFSWSKNIKKLNVRLGLRAEYTDIEGSFQKTGSVVESDFLNLIPNVQVAQTVSKVYSYVGMYSIKLARPFLAQLNPFVNMIDTLNISQGNPDLRPQTVHSFSFQNKFMKGKFFSSVTLTGAYSRDIIVPVPYFNKTTGVTTTTFENAGQEFIVGLMSNITTPIGKKINLSINAGTRYNRIRNVKKADEVRSAVAYNTSLNFQYRVVGALTLTAGGNAISFPTTLVNRPIPMQFYQLGAGYKFLKDKLALTVNFNNFHTNRRKFVTVTEDANFRTSTSFNNPYRALNVGMTFNFGKLKENTSKKKGVNNDDLVQ